MSGELEILQRRFDRERLARKAAETALEQESLKLYNVNQQLAVTNSRLEGRVAEEVGARQESEAQASSIVEAAMDAVVAVNDAGRIVSWNRRAHALFGYEPAEAIGRDLAELIDSADPAATHMRLPAVLSKARLAAGGCRVESVVRTRHGVELPAELSVAASNTPGGNVLSMFVRDMRQQVQIEQRRTTLYRVATVLAEAPTIAIARQNILQAICESIGWQVGMKWDVDEKGEQLVCVGAWSTPATAEMVAGSPAYRFSNGVGLPGRVWKTGAPAWIIDPALDPNFPRARLAEKVGLRSGVAFPIKIENRVVGVMEFFSTDRRTPDRDLLDVFSAIGSQIGVFVQRRLAEDAAQAARRAAEQASKAKSEFLAKMSHEIRTPLNGIVGIVDLLGQTSLDEQQRRYLQIANSSSQALLAIINDILDFSKIEAGHMELDTAEFEVRRVVEDAVDAFSSIAAKKGLELGSVIASSVPEKIVGDAGRFRQILLNLIGNAVKFTHAGRVIVRLASDHAGETKLPPVGRVALRVEVDDSGIGVPPDKLDRLFKSFSQADASTTRTYGGTGLGLAISGRLTQLMGGTIGVRANHHQGSTFWFTASLGEVTPSAATESFQAKHECVRALRVIAIDDKPAALEILAALLSSSACEFHSAADGVAALAILRRAAADGRPFDVALLGLKLPKVGEQSVTDLIRQDGTLSHTRLLAMGEIDERLDRDRLSAGGFHAGLTKPINQSRLFDALINSAATAPAGASKASTANLGERPPEGTRILVAEDNEINQFVVRKMLTSRGYTCDVVNNGRQALEMMERGRYDLVLMDCSMPEMDGFEATRLIRAREAAAGDGRRVPIAALTAEALNGDRERCRAVGMDDYVTKPIDPATLFGTMRRLIEQAHNRPAAADPVATTVVTQSSYEKEKPPLIDYQALLDRSLGDAEFARETLQRFGARVDEDMTALLRAHASNSFAEIMRLAHGLKGVAGHVGANRLRELATVVEKLGHESDAVALGDALKRLRDSIEETTAYIPTVLAMQAVHAGAK